MAQTDEVLFEKIFGKKSKVQPSSRMLVLRFVVQSEYKGDLAIKLESDGKTVIFKKTDLDTFLYPTLTLAAQQELNACVGTQNSISTLDLSRFGYTFSLDLTQFVLYLSVPSFKLEKKSLSLTNPLQNENAPYRLTPSGFSGFVNLGSRFALQKSDQGYSKLGQLNLLGNIYFKDWVLRGSGRFELNQPNSFDLLQVFHDFEDSAQRLTLGSSSFSTTGFMSLSNIFGATLTREWSMRPYEFFTPSFKQKVTLSEPKEVKVFVNNVVQQNFNLDPGTYEFQDFAFESGLNTIEIKVSENAAEKTIARSEFIVDTALLKQGSSEFTYGGGFIQDNSEGLLYNRGQKAVVGYNRFGVSDVLTLGAYVQKSEKTLVGAQAFLGLPWFIVGTDLGTYNFKDPKQVAGKLSLLSFSSKRTYFLDRYQFQFSYFGSDFSPNSQGNSTQYEFSNLLYFNIFDKGTLSTRFFLTQSYGVGVNTGYSLSMIYPYLGIDWRLNVTAANNQSTGSTFSIEFGGSLSPENRQSQTDIRYKLNDAANLNFTFNPNDFESYQLTSQFVSGKNYSLSGQYTNDKWTHQLQMNQQGSEKSLHQYANYISNRFYLRQSSDYSLDTGFQQGSVEYDTALCFADGVFAFSKTVQNNFTILYPHKNFQNSVIEFNGSRIDQWGPAVVTDLAPYRQSQVLVKNAQVPLGADLGDKSWVVRQKNGSGMAIQIGKEGKVLVLGKLSFDTGEAAQYLSGEVQNKNSGQTTNVLFTNKKGQFQLTGLLPGNYVMIFYTPGLESIEFTIPDGTTGKWLLNELIIRHKVESEKWVTQNVTPTLSIPLKEVQPMKPQKSMFKLLQNSELSNKVRSDKVKPQFNGTKTKVNPVQKPKKTKIILEKFYEWNFKWRGTL